MEEIKIATHFYIENDDLTKIDLNTVKNVRTVYFNLLEDSRTFSEEISKNKKGELKGSKGVLSYSTIPIECTYGAEISTRYDIICLILATWARTHGNPYIKMETLEKTFGLSEKKITTAISKKGTQFCIAVVKIAEDKKGIAFKHGQYKELMKKKEQSMEQDIQENKEIFKQVLKEKMERISSKEHIEKVVDYFKQNTDYRYYINNQEIIDDIISQVIE